MRRAIRQLAAIAVAGLASTCALATPAHAVPATGTCSFSVVLPPVVGLSQTSQLIHTQLSIDCPAAASYSLDVRLVGTDNYNGGTLVDLHYDEHDPAPTFQLAGCLGGYIGSNGHYSAELVSASAEDPAGGVISSVQLRPSSFVAVNSAYPYAASSRQGHAVYINGLLKVYGFYLLGDPPAEQIGCGLMHAGGGTMYLQRLLNGSWQTMLSRTMTGNGTTTVGFVQNTVYRYRWVVLSYPASPAGVSGYPDGLLGSASVSTVR